MTTTKEYYQKAGEILEALPNSEARDLLVAIMGRSPSAIVRAHNARNEYRYHTVGAIPGDHVTHWTGLDKYVLRQIVTVSGKRVHRSRENLHAIRKATEHISIKGKRGLIPAVVMLRRQFGLTLSQAKSVTDRLR